ncbi:MAG: transglycosylase domain-containing protein [Leptothrix sp. (in: b-proteobacteria)]
MTRPQLIKWGLGLLAVLGLAQLVLWEMNTSTLQAYVLAAWARELTFSRQPGASANIRFPQAGPYDERLGYTRLPEFLPRLIARDYAVTAQAQQSGALMGYLDNGFFAPYRERSQAGLQVLDCRGEPLFTTHVPQQVYASFEVVPPLVAQTLAFVENREVLSTAEPKHNPALEWARMGRAVLDQASSVLDSNRSGAGGSTLATQIEKFRHSADGRTAAPIDKVHQLVSASVRAYMDGEETLAARQRIVLDYLNSLPLGALRGWGEVHGVNDGLAAWYGTDVSEANRLLRQPSEQADGLPARALALRQMLSLIMAQRRPAFYFGAGQPQLIQMTASYLRLLADAGVIGPALRDAALQAPLQVRQSHSGPIGGVEVSDRKAANLLRVQLGSLLDTPRMYELDRFDLSVTSSIDGQLQRAITERLDQLRQPEVARAAGLVGFQLLEKGDPSQLLYSFTLYEREHGMNLVRVQTDNLDQPFDINGGAKLELGSTAKLRTLATYLEIITALHAELSPLDKKALAAVVVGPKDRLSRWAVDYLSSAADKSLPLMLDAAMERHYSASPGEAFFTGGGVHRFENFHSEDNGKVMPVSQALRDSVNLVFIRLMRDVAYHYMYRAANPASRVLEDDADPQREVLLRRFADREGSLFMRGFFRKHQGKTLDEMLDGLLISTHRTVPRLAVIYRSVVPDATLDDFSAFVARALPGVRLSPAELRTVYERHAPGHYSLPDRGYLAHVHPLELWVAAYLREHPNASQTQVLEASAAERQEVYSWLLRSRAHAGQNSRIISLLEVDAFIEIQRSWQRLGYPFDTLVPSFATAIGSSGDRPAALAELMGIILNDGVRDPTVHLEGLSFAAGTPYENVLHRQAAKSERVMASEVAQTLQKALAVVVEEGTARRLKGALDEPGATPLRVGGKTGTGDNRLNSYTRGGGLIGSKVTSRTATFVFYLGDRHFGTLTAFVLGQSAGDYRFTSALPVQILKTMAPLLKPVVGPTATAGCPSGQ